MLFNILNTIVTICLVNFAINGYRNRLSPIDLHPLQNYRTILNQNSQKVSRSLVQNFAVLKFFSLEAVIRFALQSLLSFSLTKFREFHSLTRTEFRNKNSIDWVRTSDLPGMSRAL